MDRLVVKESTKVVCHRLSGFEAFGGILGRGFQHDRLQFNRYRFIMLPEWPWFVEGYLVEQILTVMAQTETTSISSMGTMV